MFLIRADGNAEIGAGHLMRCLTIADELRRHMDGGEILFICADRQSAELARNRGYEAFVLGSDPHDMEAELPAWSRVPDIHKSANNILVDSYFVTEYYLRTIRKYGAVTLLDDMGAERFHVDRIINYNAFADRGQYEKLYRGSGTELILGSAYVPVRPQFRETSYRVREKAENILITAGGGDIDNIAGRILKALQETAAGITAEKLNYHMIIGRFSPCYEEMKALEGLSANVRIYHDVQDMAGLMSQCELAITAGGSTVYELAAMGVPFICFSYAENQEMITEYLDREEIAYSAGKYHKDPEAVLKRIAEQAIALVRDYGKRCDCFFRERKLTDGMGAERLAGILAAASGEAMGLECRKR